MRLKDDGTLDLDWREARRPWWMKTPEMLKRLANEYPLIEAMIYHRIPITRESYLLLAFPDGVPDPLPAEEEAELPEPLQLNPEASARLGFPSSKTPEQLDEEMGERILANVLRDHPGLTREEAQKMLDHFL
jgi:hypothetical protein